MLLCMRCGKLVKGINADGWSCGCADDAVVVSDRPVAQFAMALHAEERSDEIRARAKEMNACAAPMPFEEAEREVHAIMWQRETPAVRERYAVRAVALLAWMGGGA